ncbi:hypothetical protein CHS0354_028746 [Potamilus streckersoni]|uniref:Uncharacterized protein n=1 Tax=Potamilus streckersoni TaxID=2493646 RepID=A0AAE0S927_9BIVA|nr:hypothetical protein CHS0354_028746 [Potamilus streckersoni]
MFDIVAKLSPVENGARELKLFALRQSYAMQSATGVVLCFDGYISNHLTSTTTRGNMYFEISFKTTESSCTYIDLLQLMINAHQEEGTDVDDGEEKGLGFDVYKKRGMTDAEVLANAITFFLAAYDTTSNLLTFASYCLATNQDVQDRVRTEINKELG